MHQSKILFSLEIDEETLMKLRAHALDEGKSPAALASSILTQCLDEHVLTDNKSILRYKSTVN